MRNFSLKIIEGNRFCSRAMGRAPWPPKRAKKRSSHLRELKNDKHAISLPEAEHRQIV